MKITELVRIRFYWSDNSVKGKALATDKAFVCVYNEQLNNWIYGLDLATKAAGVCTFNVSQFNGKLVQTYIGFISADGKDVTDSLYTGMVSL